MYKNVDILAFRDRLEEACKARDSSASVTIKSNPLNGEYLAVVRTDTNQEVYAFNPQTGAWVICYQL